MIAKFRATAGGKPVKIKKWGKPLQEICEKLWFVTCGFQIVNMKSSVVAAIFFLAVLGVAILTTVAPEKEES